MRAAGPSGPGINAQICFGGDVFCGSWRQRAREKIGDDDMILAREPRCVVADVPVCLAEDLRPMRGHEVFGAAALAGAKCAALAGNSSGRSAVVWWSVLPPDTRQPLVQFPEGFVLLPLLLLWHRLSATLN